MLLVLVGAVSANDIPGYIGNQSFKLQDDQELGNVNRRAEDAKVNVARAEQAQEQIGNQLRILENQQASIKDKMELLAKEVSDMKNAKTSLVTKLDELKKTPEVNAEAITNITKEIADLDAKILERNKIAGALKLESAPLNVRIDQVRSDFNIAARKTEDARQRMQVIAREREEYRLELIAAIKKINYEGSRVGQSDGSSDGADLAWRMANDRGAIDGSNDGGSSGTRDGQDRFYRRGSEQGERDGSARARQDGVRDGSREGTLSGNSTAGSREGRIAGLKRGDASDAASVGTIQGKKAGFDRAVVTGAANGRNIGESETTKKLETQELKEVGLDGSFAGSFARRSPDYPGDFNGSNFRPSINHSKEILRKAYADGYLFNYRQFTRYEFERRIDNDYNLRYDASFKTAYDQAVNRDYPAYYDQGRRDADARAYGRDYPVIKGDAFKLAFDQFNANPNRGSGEYKASYAQSELSAYNERYEAIRVSNFDRVELEVFNANISAQTEIYRQKRTAEVTAIYNNHAVLDFVSSEMFDGGIKGVAKLDGVFQPSETAIHNVVIRNFGFKNATNVSVVLNDGQSFQIPSIPARSLVSIKGAGQSSVTSGLNTTFKSSLKVISPLTSQDAVEARHFDRLNGGVLKEADIKNVRVVYPLALSGLSLESQLLKGTKNKLKITLTNNSKREYKGELRIKLLVNSQNPIIAKEFSTVGTLASSLSLSDAEILVDSEEDAYRDLSFSASIEQNGVLIGILPADFVTMAKAQFADKGNVPVLVANSDSHLDRFLDALNTLGGSDKVSILDLSLASLNAGTISNGLSEKVLLIVDDANGSSIKSLNTFISKSKTSAYLFIDDAISGLKNVQSLPALKDAVKLSYGKRPVVFSNPHRATGVLKASSFMQSSLANMKADLRLSSLLALSAPKHLAVLNSEVTADGFATPNDAIKTFSLKALSEVLAINIAYDESGGIFSRDKKWAKMIAEDGSLFHNQLKSASSGDVVVSKLPMILSAIAMKETISSAMNRGEGIYRDMKLKITNATNDVLKNMENSYEKNLKKNFKELYNRAYANKATHNPFFIPEPTNPNNF